MADLQHVIGNIHPRLKEPFTVEDAVRSFFKRELKEWCNDLGIPTSGNKDKLVLRIFEQLPLNETRFYTCVQVSSKPW
jgi:hypothetical protein